MATLLLCLILFALGSGLLSKQSALYEGSMQQVRAAQARALAQTGLQDALAKLMRDDSFPPLSSEGQQVFSYTEDLSDLDGRPAGSYNVQIDRSLARRPWYVMRITSQGRVGDSRYTLRGELDVALKRRSQPGLDNPDLFHWIQVEDLSGL